MKPLPLRDFCSRRLQLNPIAAALAAGLFSLNPDAVLAANLAVGVDGCTLANAIGNANSDTDGDGASGCVAGSGADVITLPASSTQTLRAALPDIASVITIEGNGAKLKRRSSAAQFRILSVIAGGNLTLNNTTVTGGFPAAGDFPTGAGGGISNVGGALTLNGCTVSGIVKGGIPISGLFDLSPFRYSWLQPKLLLTHELIQQQSPLFHIPPAAPPLLISVGEEEPAGFHRQSADYLAAWRAQGLRGELLTQAGKNHFTAIEGLADAGSPFCHAVMEFMRQCEAG